MSSTFSKWFNQLAGASVLRWHIWYEMKTDTVRIELIRGRFYRVAVGYSYICSASNRHIATAILEEKRQILMDYFSRLARGGSAIERLIPLESGIVPRSEIEIAKKKSVK